jgi:hypothetical protein
MKKRATSGGHGLLIGGPITKETQMKKHQPTKKLTLNAENIRTLTEGELTAAAGGLMLTRPYTKVSVCTGGGPCASELCG